MNENQGREDRSKGKRKRKERDEELKESNNLRFREFIFVCLLFYRLLHTTS